jgi:two-component system, OmpR family, phosphate regulon sensor histidine kinase PhoR
MRRKRLLWQLFPSYLAVILLSLAAATWYASSAARNFYWDQTYKALESRARAVEWFISAGYPIADSVKAGELCKQISKATGDRITIILPTGKVIGDSDHDPETMENHADRREVQEALDGKVGRHVRKSPTLDIPMMYVAVTAVDESGNRIIIRTATPLSHINEAIRSLQMKIALVGIFIALVAAAISLWVSRHVTRPIEEMKLGVARLAGGDLDHRLAIPATDEVASLAEMLNEMAAQLADRMNFIATQRNEQEAVFASMAEGGLAGDTRERVLRMTPAAGRFLHADPVTAHGKPLLEVVRNLELKELFTRSLTSDDPTEGEIHLRQDGEQWLQAHGATLQDAAGHRMGALVVLNDVTRIRRLEGFRRDFVANVSHELRTPITSIKGFVETLLDGAIREPESAEKFLAIIARQADRMNAIIGDLLLLSRLEQEGNAATLQASDASMCGIVESAVQLCRPKAEARQISITVRCEEGLRARVNAALLEQAVANIVDNAVKYSEAGKVVRVEAMRQGNKAAIQVQDEGCGIEAEHLSRIFERFYRVDKGRSRDLGGTGLGLAIVKHIVQAHGGSVTVQSLPGKGSTFTLSIPANGTAALGELSVTGK